MWAGVLMRATFAVGIIALVTSLVPGPGPNPSPPPQACDGHEHRHTAAEHRHWLKKHWDNPRLTRKVKQKNRHMIRCAATPTTRKAMRRTWRSVQLPRYYSTFIRIGRCEQPGSGYAGIDWTVSGPTYMGGLGFWYGTYAAWRPATWKAFAGKRKPTPANAGDAHWRLQMLVAARVADDVGFSAWGCY